MRRINGFTHLNLTKLDVLSKLDTIKLGIGYSHNGQVPSISISVSVGLPFLQSGVVCVHALSLHATAASRSTLTTQRYGRFGGIYSCTLFAPVVQELPSVPSDLETLEAVEVVYEEHPGWQQDISGARSWDELPPNAHSYIKCAAAGLHDSAFAYADKSSQHAPLIRPSRAVAVGVISALLASLSVLAASSARSPACQSCAAACCSDLARQCSQLLELHEWCPGACRRIEELLGVQCTWIGVGPGREAMVVQDCPQLAK